MLEPQSRLGDKPFIFQVICPPKRNYCSPKWVEDHSPQLGTNYCTYNSVWPQTGTALKRVAPYEDNLLFSYVRRPSPSHLSLMMFTVGYTLVSSAMIESYCCLCSTWCYVVQQRYSRRSALPCALYDMNTYQKGNARCAVGRTVQQEERPLNPRSGNLLTR